tara:strand:- start:3902 stop:4741 length:840 start_codon:yes stop_codon:yes gene_type:complete
MKPSTKIATITPAQAKEWLEKYNDNYRAMNIPAATQLARAVREGNFHFNGESIKFNSKGMLVDGQHRLLACVMADKPIELVVVTGVDHIHEIDTGRPKNAADALTDLGEHNVGSLASAARTVWKWEHNLMGKHHSAGKASVTDVIGIVGRRPGLRESVVLCYRDRTIVSTNWLAGLHYLWRKVSFASADTFVADLNAARDISKTDPIFRLRTTLIKEARSRSKMSQVMRQALGIKAFNSYYNGREVKSLSWNPFGTNAEKFPQIVCLPSPTQGENNGSH